MSARNGLAVYPITIASRLHILIDTALPRPTPQIKSSNRKLGIQVADIRISSQLARPISLNSGGVGLGDAVSIRMYP